VSKYSPEILKIKKKELTKEGRERGGFLPPCLFLSSLFFGKSDDEKMGYRTIKFKARCQGI